MASSGERGGAMAADGVRSATAMDGERTGEEWTGEEQNGGERTGEERIREGEGSGREGTWVAAEDGMSDAYG